MKMGALIIIILSTTFVLASGIEQKNKVQNKKSVSLLTKRYNKSNSQSNFKCESKKYCELKWISPQSSGKD